MTTPAPQPLPEDVRQQAIPALAHTVGLLLALRRHDPPAPWGTVAKALGLAASEVNRYRWLIAAELFAINGSWTATEQHPAVDFAKDTVRKGHSHARLPGGLTWAGFIADYQRAYQARLAELQQARGEQDAETIAALGRRSLDVLSQLQTRIEQCVADPPALIKVSKDLSIPGLAAAPAPPPQMRLDFDTALAEMASQPIPTPADPAAEPVLSIEAARYLLGAQQEVLAGLEKASRLLTGLPLAAPGEDADSAPTELTAAEIRDLNDRIARKQAELAGYVEAA